MKVLFAHDHRFFLKDNSIFSKVDFGVAMWKRYIDVFDNLVIAARIENHSTIQDYSNMNQTKLSDNISIVQLKSFSGIKNLITNKKREYEKLEKSICTVDFVIARLPSEIGLSAIKIADKHKVPYLIELVGSPFDAYWYRGSLMAKVYAPIISRRVKRAVNRSTHVIYVTENYLQSKYPNRKKSISCSNINVDINYEYEELASKANKFKSIKSADKIKIGLNGSLSSNYKGIDTAIETLSRLDDKYILHILGAGSKDKWFEYARKCRVEKRVFFDGSLPSGEPVLEWLDDIDIYIQPSQTEGLPRALIEAMSRGCLCIGSNKGGIPELLPKGRMHNAGDSFKLKEMIEDITNSVEEMLEISRRNYNKSKEYSYEIINKRRSDFFKDFKES